ncbi:MAG: hypothetical protein CL916_11200 [Deltaproteobacteria bacterium]|nr:hypothetical protein [Deltaproteobacteria bacterium]
MIRSPHDSITGGYDVHLVFTSSQQELAKHLFTACLDFLHKNDIAYQNHRIFSRPVGPWPTCMWQFELPFSSRVHQDLGLCISWLMLNRGVFSVMVHPNTKKENGQGGALEDHGQNHLWLGAPMPLKMSIFT